MHRWPLGSISETERDLISFDRRHFAKVLVHALTHRNKGSKTKIQPLPPIVDIEDKVEVVDEDKENGRDARTAANLVQQIDDPQAEEQAVHSERMGRWRKDSIKLVQCDVFWCVLGVAKTVHEPITHLFNFLNSKLSKYARPSSPTGVLQGW